jgi:hypothetical protein
MLQKAKAVCDWVGFEQHEEAIIACEGNCLFFDVNPGFSFLFQKEGNFKSRNFRTIK